MFLCGLSLGWEEAGLLGKVQEMEGEGRTQLWGQLGPGAVTTCDKIGVICELEGSGSQEFSPWSLSNISGSMTALLWERLPEAGRGSEQD